MRLGRAREAIPNMVWNTGIVDLISSIETDETRFTWSGTAIRYFPVSTPGMS